LPAFVQFSESGMDSTVIKRKRRRRQLPVLPTVEH
jgi:hypothetical protein